VVDGEWLEGSLACAPCGKNYPILRGIPRFVPEQNYAESFGYEWTLYGDLQYDRLQDNTLTHDRFYSQLGLTAADLRGKKVLEAGCGGGRFSDVVLQSGAELHAIDLSVAVDKNRELHPSEKRLNLAQASILEPPYAPGTFDVVFCFGVIQHTPDPAVTFRALAALVKPGGRIAIDVYAAHPKQSSHWKYFVRPVTKHMDHATIHTIIDSASHVLFPISKTIRRIPVLGKPLSRVVPIFVHDGFLGRVPLHQERRWAVLETLDALTPAHDHPRSARTLRKWLENGGFTDVRVATTMNSLNYATGIRPA
jgi:SAM-dependent methyltransferase